MCQCIISSFLSILFIITYTSNCSCGSFRDTWVEIFELAIFYQFTTQIYFWPGGENILLTNHWTLFLRFLKCLISSLLWSCCNLCWEWECPLFFHWNQCTILFQRTENYSYIYIYIKLKTYKMFWIKRKMKLYLIWLTIYNQSNLFKKW